MKDNEYIDKDSRQENSGSTNQKRATKKKKIGIKECKVHTMKTNCNYLFNSFFICIFLMYGNNQIIHSFIISDYLCGINPFNGIIRQRCPTRKTEIKKQKQKCPQK